MQIDDSHLDWFHEETAHNPLAWYYTAETLFRSSEFILGGLQNGPAATRLAENGLMDSHYNSYGLLLGYALENILKGLWVSKGGVLVDQQNPGKLVRIDGVADHNLLPLARKVGVTLSTGEKDVVNRLSYWITAAGRYPVPLRAVDMKSREVSGRGKVAPGYFSADDWDQTFASRRRRAVRHPQ